MHPKKLILDYVYDNEAAQPDAVLLVQPTGNGEVIEFTWGQVLDQSRRMAAYLQSLELAPGARVAMLAKNSAHFVMAELAIWMAGGTTVAIFPTETAANIQYVLEHSEASMLFVGKLDTWEQQIAGVPAGLPRIALPLSADFDSVSWEPIVARTQPLQGRPQRLAADLAMLLYTSGSTGHPKGVMQNFGTITATIEAGMSDPAIQLPDGVERRVMSYLPLAHAYERAVIACRMLVEGQGRIYFGESLATFVDDIKRARPTVFYSVPRLWLKFQQSAQAAVGAEQLETALADPSRAPIIGKKVLQGLGLDEVRLALSASAPLSPELMQWYRRLGLNLLEGYGMTEDFAYSHRTTLEFNTPGHVGIALTGVQARIDNDGEILIKSPGQMAGYYKRPDLNEEVFTEDGFFRTGDLGVRSEDGQLRLTGRKKELFKTAKGKYVAPAPIETKLQASPLVELAMVSGVGKPAAYGALILAEQLRPQMGDTAVRARAKAGLTQLLEDVNTQLAQHERLQFLVVLSEPWTTENGMLTPTLKIKRSRIEESVASHLDAWYAIEAPVIWD